MVQDLRFFCLGLHQPLEVEQSAGQDIVFKFIHLALVLLPAVLPARRA